MNPSLWTRQVLDGIPIYLQGDKPDWFVPNSAGDRLLQQVQGTGDQYADPAIRSFLDRLPEDASTSYPGRAELLGVNHLSEIWFHVTNNCNQSCNHCLFSCSNKSAGELPLGRILEIADQAAALGCRVFALTGGEPFVHRDIVAIIDGLLGHEGAHVVVLTNALLLGRYEKDLARWPEDRFHLQISADGMQANHDALRGPGAFARLERKLQWLAARELPYTISMCAGRHNHPDMPAVVDFAAGLGAAGVHFMWYFARGRGNTQGMEQPKRLFESTVAAGLRAEALGIGVDNLDALRTQVFAPSGTVHDGGNSGWESIAVGPDGLIYPSAALIGLEPLATRLNGNLAEAWRRSPVLSKLRAVTAARLKSPWRYIIGGGDPDHSYIFSGDFAGEDPYRPLYEKLAQWLIAREAARQPAEGPPRLRLKMGDILESCGAHGAVALVHSNCLVSVAGKDTRTVVKEFYSRAAAEPRAEIVNPVAYPDELIDHIPEKYRFRGYGCGSPILDADLVEGETLLDLGCGGGVECFIAARLLGRQGRVIGVDMLEPMLARARSGASEVAERLGYDIIEFRREYLEQLSLGDASIDVVVSNCVLNLSKDKRRTFAEIYRVLRPGGRLVVADVVSERESDPEIRNNELLRGECIAGAMTQTDLFALLEESGFTARRVIKRFPYRTLGDQQFFSMTFSARRPTGGDERLRVIYRGPLARMVTQSGTLLTPGTVREVAPDEIAGCGDEILVLEQDGAVANLDMGPACSCALESAGPCCTPQAPPAPEETRRRSGCMVCGAALDYLDVAIETACAYCGRKQITAAVCADGHFVCDACHTRDGLVAIRRICLTTTESDMIALMTSIRRHPSIPLHGPEHHAMLPGIIIATYRNLGGKISDEQIETGIERGSQVAGGYCGFVGACGAALGVGIAFSIIMGANPIKAAERQTAQIAVHAALGEIASFEAARCCQRDSWIALREAARLSRKMLPIELQAQAPLVCRQHKINKECIEEACPLFDPAA